MAVVVAALAVLIVLVGGLAVSLYRQFGLLEVEQENRAQHLRNLEREVFCLSGRLARMEIRRDDWEGDFGSYRSTRPVTTPTPQRFTVEPKS